MVNLVVLAEVLVRLPLTMTAPPGVTVVGETSSVRLADGAALAASATADPCRLRTPVMVGPTPAGAPTSNSDIGSASMLLSTAFLDTSILNASFLSLDDLGPCTRSGF